MEGRRRKAARELEYELALRPDWTRVPIRGMRAILEGARRAEHP